MPLLIAGFFVLQLDRSNIGNALTDTIVEDLGITTDDVNLGNQLMLAGIVIAEIPSNIILQRLGAPIWLTIQMFIWGMIALTQAWCTDIHSFLATRFLLGLFEGGYIPGAQYMLALFYTRDELALRTAVFYFGNYSATAFGSLIAAGVLQMGGTNGLSGWQWLFISKIIRTRFLCIELTMIQSKAPLLFSCSSASLPSFPEVQRKQPLFTPASTSSRRGTVRFFLHGSWPTTQPKAMTGPTSP